MVSLVKEEYLYLLVPISQSERHSKAQEISLASKVKARNSVDMYDKICIVLNRLCILGENLRCFNLEAGGIVALQKGVAIQCE